MPLFESSQTSFGLRGTLQRHVTYCAIVRERLLGVVHLQLQLALANFVPLQFFAFERQQFFFARLLLQNPIHLKTELVQALFRS